jgi:hypothetical protein
MNKLRLVRKWLSNIKRGEAGQVLPAVLAMTALGSMLIVPTLNYVSTSLKTGEMVEEELEGLYAAEAGMEDALWEISNWTEESEPDSFPYTYELTDINGLTVSVTIEEITTVSGKEVGTTGHHDEYLIVEKTVTYADNTYYYTLTLINSGTGNVKIEMILVDFPPDVEYVEGSTGGDLYNGDPVVVGDSDIGITLYWELIPPYPTIPEASFKVHTFELDGDEGIEDVEGHACVRANRQDVGTVWDVESKPYSILSEAKDASETVIASVKVGLWEGFTLDISCWQVNP